MSESSKLAERAVLGACLIDPTVAAELLAIAPPGAFEHPGHATIAAVIAALVAEKIPSDPVSVLQRLTDNGEAAKVGGGAYLHTLMGCCYDVAGAVRQAELVAEAQWRRRVLAEATRVAQVAESPNVDTDRLLEQMTRLFAQADTLGGVRPVLPSSLADLLDRSDEPEWLCEGLIERMERVIITSLEGGGKTELVTQVALCLAGGIHPFTTMPIDPVRVLVVDLENGWANLRRRYGRINALVEAVKGSPMDRTALMVESVDAGLDLTRADDQRLLSRLVEGSRAALVCVGPLYKMHRSNMNDEQAARCLTAVLDDIRTAHGVAFLIEAHAGQAEEKSGRRKVRPRGSSLFLGWPNVGIGLRPVEDESDTGDMTRMELVHWRGARDERAWPRQIRRGFNGSLPWVPVSAADHAAYAARMRR